MSNPVRPHRWQPTRLPRPWDSPGKNSGVGCHFLLQCITVKSESEVAQSCPTLSNHMDCSPPGSSIHGVFQVRVLEWGALPWNFFSPCFTYLDVFHCFLVYGLWELNRICILLLCENCVNYVELVPSTIQVYHSLLLFCLFILLIFESLILKLQLEIFIFFKKIIAIYSETVCNLVRYFPSLL